MRRMRAAVVLSAVGSLENPCIRFAGAAQATALAGRFEIVCLSGTASREGAHLHIAIADAQGSMIGGHVGPGCRVYTTAEIVLAELRAVVFARRFDPRTGYRELRIGRRWR
jgi:uncharacterized protein